MRTFLIAAASAATLLSTAAFSQQLSQSTASVPDFSGMWVHGSIPGFEPLASGPTSLVNRSRRTTAQLLRDNAEAWLGAGEPPSQDGVSYVDELVGDYTNPILKPDAAEIVKKFGEMSLAKVPFPSSAQSMLAWSVTSGVNFTQNQRFEFPYDVVSASSPDPIEDATVLGPIKAKPCGWPRRRGQP